MNTSTVATPDPPASLRELVSARIVDKGDVVPEGVSLDHIAIVAGLLERMAQQTLSPRATKKPRGGRR